MSGIRPMVQDSSGLVRNARAGDGFIHAVLPTVIAADANDTVTVDKIAGGVIQYTGFTAGRTLTTDTAANIIAAFPNLDVGESVRLEVSIVPAFAGTWAAGTGVTLAGRTTTPASSTTVVYITKTSGTAVTWRVL